MEEFAHHARDLESDRVCTTRNTSASFHKLWKTVDNQNSSELPHLILERRDH